MVDRRYTYMNIGGVRTCIGMQEDEAHVRQVETYINGKLKEVAESPSYSRLPEEQQRLMLLLNMADDAVRAMKRAEEAEARLEEMDTQVDDLKYKLVSDQIRREKEENGRRRR